jgi:hypothetical protein
MSEDRKQTYGEELNDMLKENTNTSSYDMISKILASNNFTFQPLPNFINFNDENVMTSIFKPFNYGTDSIPKGACGPSFVCVYLGERSKVCISRRCIKHYSSTTCL